MANENMQMSAHGIGGFVPPRTVRTPRACLLLKPTIREELMSYVYSKVDDLENTEKVGSRQCVALVQTYAKLPNTIFWKEGKSVSDSLIIPKGTAIATFVDGKYQSHSTGNHAAFFVSKGAGGIWIMDQWVNDETKPNVSKRFIRRKGDISGAYVDPSNNADAYSIIE